MNISAPFIQRPIATALVMVGLLVAGLVTYRLLPVAALPEVNYPTLQAPGNCAVTCTSPLRKVPRPPGCTICSKPMSLVSCYVRK